LLIEADTWDDAEWLAGLIQATADALPMPKPKKAKQTT
jgi:DNA transformation protein and related proteins